MRRLTSIEELQAKKEEADEMTSKVGQVMK
jgi:hypothetical protein